MSWIILILAGFGEVIGVIGINKWNQRKALINMVIIVTGFLVSFILLSIAMEGLAMGTAYAVWTGIGTVGSALAGIIFYKESADWKRIMFISCIVVAVVGLKLVE